MTLSVPTFPAAAVDSQASNESDATRKQADATSSIADDAGLIDEPIADHVRQLLELAFDAASAIPSEPHLKTKCLRQEEVVAACLTLKQPRLALAYAEKINDWRRGAAFADLAMYCIQNDRPQQVEQFLAMARQIAMQADDWRRDHIRTKVARAHVWLGQEARAAELEAGAVNSEIGRVESARAERAEPGEFEARMAALQESLSSGDFDLIRGALDACAILYDRFYSDAEKRSRLESVMRANSENLHVLVRLEQLLTLARIAAKHDDMETGRGYATQARSFLSLYGWIAQDKVPWLGRVAAVEHLVGMDKEALEDVNAAIALYMTDLEDIVPPFRSGTLWPVAEAHQAMDRLPAALSIYTRALDEAASNPNARPRANDLIAACLSMALSNVQPDDAVWKRLREMRSGLEHPW